MTELVGTPSLPVLFGKAALTGSTRSGKSLPSTEYTRSGVRVSTAHLGDYVQVCGLPLRDVLPATYPHMLTFPMSAKLMTDPGFPFPLVGLVHVRNVITVHTPLLVNDKLDLAVHVANLADHPKGTQFEMISEVYTRGELAWREVSTYLRRGGSSGSAAEERGERPEPPEPTAIWRVPADIGRRYAQVSGDANPIHLSQFTAKLFGFNKAIAHGMWTKAHCLGALKLPETYSIDVRFQTPIMLPAKVGFSSTADTFSLHNVRNGKPHLSGSITPG